MWRGRGTLSFVDGPTRQREEHFVERGAAQADVVDLDAGVVEGANHLGQSLRAVLDTDGDAPVRLIDRRVLLVAEPGEHLRGGREVGVMADANLDAVAAGPALQFVGGPGGDRPAVIDDHDLVGELVGFLEILRGQQHVGARRHEHADGVPQLEACARIEAGGRLVEQQQPGCSHEAGTEVEAAAHATRVATHEPVGGVREIEAVEDHVGGVPGRGGVVAEHAGDHHEVLPAGEGRLDGGVLAGQPDRLAHAVGIGDDVDAVDEQAALVGQVQRGDGAHERRLAGPVGTEDGGDLTAGGDEVETVEGDDRLVSLAEALVQPRRLDDRWWLVHDFTMTKKRGHPMTRFVCDDRHMRADRLVATLLVLQSRGRVTATELADELEVSVKTARRDLEALAIAGIPVYSQPGRNGGWQLIGGARTDLSGLTEAEAKTLFMVAGPASTATPEAKAALRKLVQALPETFRADAELAATSTVLDPASWGRESVARPQFLDELRRAIVAGVQVRLGYADRTRTETTRVVHPLGLVEKGSTWYLVGDTDNGLRTFRVNRVRAVELTGAKAERPPDFDLAAVWQEVVDTVERKRARLQAVVRVDRRGYLGLREQFGPTTRIVADPAADGNNDRIDVEVGAGSAWIIAQHLAGWADYVEVISPPEVRDRLAEIGRLLVAHYV